MVNISVLVDGDVGLVFVVEGCGIVKLFFVFKFFDVYLGIYIFFILVGDGSIMVLWGKGIIGYVVEIGDIVFLMDVSLVSL